MDSSKVFILTTLSVLKALIPFFAIANPSFAIDVAPTTDVMKKKGAAPARKQLLFQNGRHLLKMSEETRTIYETVSRRKLVQAVVDDTAAVLVKDIVTVSEEGRGNFTTITDAVNAAPSNTYVADKGYFLVYITAGVYEEYVSIPEDKKNLMIMGDGINKTIITGNRSIVDGWKTFNSATFGNHNIEILKGKAEGQNALPFT